MKENANITHFPELPGWKAVRHSKEVSISNRMQMHHIYNKDSQYVGFISSKGVVNLIDNKGNSYPTERTFEYANQLTEAVMYCKELIEINQTFFAEKLLRQHKIIA